MRHAGIRLVTTVALAALAGAADAAVVVVTESEGPAAPAAQGAKPARPQHRGTMYVDGDRVRIDGSTDTKDGEMEGTVLFRAQPESFVFLNAGDKSYTEMTREDAKRIGGAIENARKQMQAQLAKMPPEQPNFIAFFRRDYKRVAELHVESGWVPPATRVEDLEGAIRTVCEPHFDRPLKDISLGNVLLRLFQTSRRFNVEIQPQLVLLQKTLLNVEGLGRQLDPELDLWATAKPFLERWMNDQVGWTGLVERLKNEAPRYAQLLPELPRLLHQALDGAAGADRRALEALVEAQRRDNRRLRALLNLLLGFAAGAALVYLWLRGH